MEKKKGKKKEKQRKRGREEERVSAEAVYIGVYRRKYSVGKTVIDFAGVSDTSLLGCPGLNPSVYTDRIIPSVYTGGIANGVFSSANTDRI